MTVQAGAPKESHFVNIFADSAARFGLCLNKEAKFRPARYSLKSQRARACEDIGDNRAVERRGPLGMSEDVKDGLAGLVTGGAGIAPARRGDIAPAHMARDDAHYLRRPDGLDLVLPLVLCANFPRPFGAGLESFAKRLALAWVPRFGLLLR